MAFETLNESDDIEKLCQEIDAHQQEYNRKLQQEDAEFQKDKSRAIDHTSQAIEKSRKANSVDKRDITSEYGNCFLTGDNKEGS